MGLHPEIVKEFPKGIELKLLTLQEMVQLAKNVPEWTPSDFISTHEIGFFGETIVDWEYEGNCSGLNVYLDRSAAGSLFNYFVRIGVVNKGKFIGYSRLKEKDAGELLELYKTVDQAHTSKKEAEKRTEETKRQGLLEKGLEKARSLLNQQ
jgi:hypothetical protein